jgi:hypothetical protein
MVHDETGNQISSTTEGCKAYDAGLRSLLSMRSTVAADIQFAVDTDPASPLAAILSAYLGLLSSERCDARVAAKQLALIDSSGRSLNPREMMHLRATRQLSAGDLYGASDTTLEISRHYPRDALALFAGHQIDFFTGAANRLEARIAAALPHWNQEDRAIGYLEGMWSFGLEELGRYEAALDVGHRAVIRNSDDAWAIHAVAHVHEMRGDYDIGVDWLTTMRSDWQIGTFMNVHIAWHNALFLLETEDWGGVLALYDSFIHNDSSSNLALQMLDASSLLWRLRLDGVDTGDRWQALADGWLSKQDEPWYSFNDMHAVMAFVSDERTSTAHEVIRRLETYVNEPGDNSNREMARRVGLPVCRAIFHHAQGDYAAAADILAPVLPALSTFGGSHAQRDVVHRTFIDALMRSNRRDLAEQILVNRLVERPRSRWSQKRLATIQKADGNLSR